MKTLLTLAVFLLFFANANAQFFSALTERADKAKDRILLIEEGDFECSEDIESLVKKYWKIGKGVELKTTGEITAMLTPENAFKYMVLTGDEKMEATYNGSSAASVVGMVLYLGENAMRRNELNIDRKFVFKVSFPSCVISEAEVLFICQHFKNYLNNSVPNNQKKSVIPVEKTQSIQNLTLLIPNNATELDIAAIKKAYKYPCKLVAPSEIEKNILAKTAGFAYVNILWSDKRFAWESVIISCVNSKVLTTAKNDYFKAAVNKKKWDKATQPLAICRTKSKLAAYEFKSINKTIFTAIEGK